MNPVAARRPSTLENSALTTCLKTTLDLHQMRSFHHPLHLQQHLSDSEGVDQEKDAVQKKDQNDHSNSD